MNAAAPEPRALHAADLSIVVQGRLNGTDAAQFTRHCQHWRDLFPEAELILSISSSDMVAPDVHELTTMVDKIVRANPAVALAPLKFGGAANNVNLQIAAAQAGLAAASRSHTLRVRSDLTLAGPILDHYANCCAATPEPSILSRRVMICHLFTLNPYTAERLPFHFSDWFQLGPTADLRKMWAIARYEAADASYYSTHPHARYSNARERDFQSRYAAEQLIALDFFRRNDSDIIMDFHNDLLCRRQAMDRLFGEFIIADPRLCRIDFAKYGHVLDHPFSDLLCVGHEDWWHFAVDRSTPDYRRYFAEKAERVGSFPRGYE